MTYSHSPMRRAAGFAAGLTIDARQPRILQPDEYGRWEQLAAQRTPLSPDGTWLVYGINRSNRQNELRFQPTAGGTPIVVSFGEQPVFTDDSKWAASLVGLSEEEEAKLRKDKKPIRKRLALVNLAARHHDHDRWRGIVLVQSHPAPTWRCGATPTHSNREDADAGETIAPGTPLVLRNLATGQDATFGSVSEIAWQDKGPLLAFAITVEGGVGNSLQVYDTTTGVLRTLDSSARTYSGLAWRKDSSSLAALRSADGSGPRRSQRTRCWSGPT